MVKVKIPRSEDQLLGLLVKISKRHNATKKRSILNGAINMDRLLEKSNNIRCVIDHQPVKSSSYHNFNKKTDLKFISKEIRCIRNLLLTIYPDEPNIIKEWGFDLKD